MPSVTRWKAIRSRDEYGPVLRCGRVAVKRLISRQAFKEYRCRECGHEKFVDRDRRVTPIMKATWTCDCEATDA